MEKAPFIDDLNEYIAEIKRLDELKEEKFKPVYFDNLEKIRTINAHMQTVFWIITLLSSSLYTLFSRGKSGFVQTITFDGEWIIRLDPAFLPLVGLRFIAPLMYTACEAWANATMTEMFQSLESTEFQSKVKYEKGDNKTQTTEKQKARKNWRRK